MKTLRAFLCLILVVSILAPTARAFHVPPWDTGHNSFAGDPGDPGADPGTGDGCNGCPCTAKAMSPVEAATGNFIYSVRPLLVSGLGPAIDLTLTYNSQDLRRGPFGLGWVNPYEQRIVETTDGATIFAICTQADGKRERFQRNPNGSYSAPAHVFATLTKNPDNTFSLRNKFGMVRRFDAQGRLAAVVDRNGNALSFAYDVAGFMNQITDASGRSVSLSKGASGKVESLTDPAGRTIRFSYNASGNLTGYTDALGNATTYQYDSAGNLTAVVDPRNNTHTRLTYDVAGRVTQHVDGAETWTYAYSPSSKRTTKRDSQNNTWTFDYNDNGNVTRIADPLGKTEQYTLDANLNVTQFTDKNGKTHRYTYDATGNQLTVTDALNNVATMTYEPVFNRPLTVRDGLGNTSRFEYDGRGNLVKAINHLGHATQFQHDSKGQVARVTDALGNSSTFTYDDRGNLTQTADPLGNTSTSTFDIIGKILTTTDAEGKSTQFFYDDDERLVKTIDPMGGVTLKEYDAAGNLTTVTLPGGGKTTYQYDSLNRLTRATNPSGQATSFTYDRRDNVSARTDAKGQTITYAYDVLDRLTRKNRPDGSVVYTRDGVGNILTVTDGDSGLTFVYDAVNRLTEARTAATAGQPATTTKFGYDANGNRKTLTDPAGGITNYQYDALQRLTSVTDPTGQQFALTYDALSRRTKIDYPFAMSTTYTYDNASRLTSLVHQGGPGASGFTYSYDRVGNRLSKADAAGTLFYTYDSLYRLAAAGPSAASPLETYAYDPLGNRTASHLSASYTHADANRLTADAAFDYVYDANGSLMRKTERATGKVTAYTYDSENQLTRIDFPDNTNAAYRYDGLGRRIEKTANGQVTRYVYDGEDILFEFSGATFAARYTHGLGADEVFAVTRDGVTSILRADALGSVTAVVDASAVKASYAYDTFGRLTSQAGTRQAPHSFQGREFDPESGLYYFRARYYDSETGRFLSEDPTGFFGGKNFYRFANNNPGNFTDPSGKIAFVPIILGAWAVFEFASSAYDAYDTAKTLSDPCESAENKLLSGGGFLLGMVAPGGGYGAGGKAAKEFFQGTRYTDKVLDQMRRGDRHGFPDIVENYADAGRVKKITGGDGVTREMLEIPGDYKGKTGVFEFIKEADGSINHRFFRADK